MKLTYDKTTGNWIGTLSDGRQVETWGIPHSGRKSWVCYAGRTKIASGPSLEYIRESLNRIDKAS